MENKLFLELEFATDIGISLAGARSWQSRVVMAGRGEGWGMAAEQEQGFTAGLYTCFTLKNTRAPISTAFL